MREKKHVPGAGSKALQDSIRSRGDFAWRFASGASVKKQIPSRLLLPDLGGPSSLVVSVVPLGDIFVDFGNVPESSQLTGSASTLEWARQHLCKRQSVQAALEPQGIALTQFGQGQVGGAGVPSVRGPLGFSVSSQIDFQFVSRWTIPGVVSRVTSIKSGI